MSLGANLRLHLIERLAGQFDGTAQGAIQEARIDQDAPDPRIFFMRSEKSQDHFLNATVGLQDSFYVIEVIGSNIDTVYDLADLVFAHLHCHTGAFGLGEVSGIIVSEAEEDYIPLGFGDDENLHFVALRIQIMEQ